MLAISPNSDNIETADDVTSILRICSEPVIICTFLYFFTSYGEKKRLGKSSKTSEKVEKVSEKE